MQAADDAGQILTRRGGSGAAVEFNLMIYDEIRALETAAQRSPSEDTPGRRQDDR